MTYRTPRQLRWWLTIGINPQPRHELRPAPRTVRLTIATDADKLIAELRSIQAEWHGAQAFRRPFAVAGPGWRRLHRSLQ